MTYESVLMKIIIDRHRRACHEKYEKYIMCLGIFMPGQLAKRPFIVNQTFVKFDRNLLNLGKNGYNLLEIKIWQTCESIWAHVIKFDLNLVNLDQIWLEYIGLTTNDRLPSLALALVYMRIPCRRQCMHTGRLSSNTRFAAI